MTEPGASGGAERPDAPTSTAARAPWSVCAAVDGDWLIFLDVARNRYQAVNVHEAPSLRKLAPDANECGPMTPGWRALLEQGLIARIGAPSSARIGDGPLGWLDVARTFRAAIWARRIVKTGALLPAFCQISAAKARLKRRIVAPKAAIGAYERFARARIWVPARFVCLFDSLTLMRVLIAQAIASDLVFGVRARPFAAHCWVEAGGVILDEGGEECGSFAEIVRV